jgi:hypothetical protein
MTSAQDTDEDTTVYVNAQITNRQGETETVYAGCLPAWAWDDAEACKPWRKVRRTALLADRTSDPRGWRVTFSADEEGVSH